MKKEIKLLTTIYKEDAEGNTTLLKSNVVNLCLIDSEDVTGPYQVLKENGTPYKTKCQIVHKDLGAVEIKHKYEEIKEWLNPPKNKIGFKTK